MKICSPQLGLAPASTLGGEVYDREVLTKLAKKGNDIYVLLPKNRPYDKSIKNLHINYAPIRTIFPAYLYSLIILPYLFKTYNRVGFNILRVHVHFLAFGALIFKIFHKKIPIVAHYHLDEDGLFFNFVNKLFLSRCDLVIADSKFLKKRLIGKYKLSPNKVAVIYCGTDLNIKPGKKDQKIQEKYNLFGKKVFIYMGRLIERKRPDFLLEIFNLVHKKYPGTALLIFGEGPLLKNLQDKIKRYSLEDCVYLLGTTFGAEKVRFYNSSDVFIFPSINEGFVLVILEALAAGLPIIASKAVSLGEAVDNHKNGILVDPYNMRKWREAMEFLIKNPGKSLEMGRLSRKIAEERVSWDPTAQNDLYFYQKIIDG